MKRSDKPTGQILLKAYTNSEWDDCEFAIINLSEEWKNEQKERLEYTSPLKEDWYFSSIDFYDGSVDFYRSGNDDFLNVNELLEGRDWSFVELNSEEITAFLPPENSMDSYRISLRGNGSAFYTAYGKHTGEQFWTADFLLNTILYENIR